MSRRLVVEADGGSRGNPGPAGYGALVRDGATGELLAERGAGIGRATNNVAEYRGLIEGLRAAVELGADVVEVRMDSKLVVEQMSGRWRIKHPQLQPLAAEAAALARQLTRVSYDWIPRAKNSHADRLANEAMDEQDGKPRAAASITTAPATTAPATTAPTTRAPAAATTWTGATGTPTRLLLLRHGQTEHSVQRRYSGRGDLPLTEAGRAQASAAARRLADTPDVAAVVCSPLRRARETAEPVAAALGLTVDVHDGLIELDFGDWEGLTFTEARDRDPEAHARWMANTTVPVPGGESVDSAHRRVRRTRDDLIARYGGATLVVVTHVTPIKTLLRIGLDAGPSLLHRLHLDLASLSIVEFYPDGPASVRLVNETSYL